MPACRAAAVPQDEPAAREVDAGRQWATRGAAASRRRDEGPQGARVRWALPDAAPPDGSDSRWVPATSLRAPERAAARAWVVAAEREAPGPSEGLQLGAVTSAARCGPLAAGRQVWAAPPARRCSRQAQALRVLRRAPVRRLSALQPPAARPALEAPERPRRRVVPRWVPAPARWLPGERVPVPTPLRRRQAAPRRFRQAASPTSRAAAAAARERQVWLAPRLSPSASCP